MDEILVRLVASGICHTDLSMQEVWPRIPGNAGRYPVVFGHEGAGVVEQVGQRVKRVRPGDAVVMSYRSCRACRECAAGHPYYCDRFAGLNVSGVRPDGSTTMHADGRPVYGSFFGQSSFATHSLAYEDNVVVVGSDIDLSVAAPFGCGVQTGAGTVMNVLALDEHSSLVVFGAGGVGLSAVMAAFASGVGTIVAVDPVASRRQLAAELGASATIDPGACDVADAIRRLTGAGVTHAIDTTAKGAVINQAIEALAPLGTLALVGLRPPDFAMNVQSVMSGGKTIRGVIEGDAAPHDLIPRLVELHSQGRLPLEKLIRRYDFGDIDVAFADAASGRTVKPVLEFDLNSC